MLKRDFKQRVKLPFIDGVLHVGAGVCVCVCVCVCGGRGGARASSKQQCNLFDV